MFLAYEWRVLYHRYGQRASFSDGAVLQRGMPVRVWGTAALIVELKSIVEVWEEL